MSKKIKDIKFSLKDQEHNPKIKEGELVGIAIQTWNNYVWSSCGYLMVPNDPEAIQKLEKKKLGQESFFWLKAEMRVEEIKKGEVFYEGEKPSLIGKKKVYVEDPDWGKKFKLIYCHVMKRFIPTKVVKNENNLLHVQIEPMSFWAHGGGSIDKLIFQGEKINKYRDLVAGNLGKEFKISLHIIDDDPKLPIDTDKWGKYEKIELAGEQKTNDRPEVPISKIKNSLEKYYQKKDIKVMKLSDEDKELMDIVFNDGQKKSSRDFLDSYDRQKFEQTKIYLQSNNKKSLEYSELTSTKISDLDLKKQKELLKEWMKENKLEEIVLRDNGDLYLKKNNGSGSILTDNQVFFPNASELNSINIKSYLQKTGKNSITYQELLSGPGKAEPKNQSNFYLTPWLIGGGISISVIIFYFIIRKKHRKGYVK